MNELMKELSFAEEWREIAPLLTPFLVRSLLAASSCNPANTAARSGTVIPATLAKDRAVTGRVFTG